MIRDNLAGVGWNETKPGYTALRDAVLTHPTLPEGLVALFSNVAVVPTK